MNSQFDADEATNAASAARGKQIQKDMEKMKDRFARLLLGEDMAGGGKEGVSSALALSNAIKNLAASVFGEQRCLVPMSAERKENWRKEIGWLLSVTDHMVEFAPTHQRNKDGVVVEVMSTRQRVDLRRNIPALKKLEKILVDILDIFKDQNEFYYVPSSTSYLEKGIVNREDGRWSLPRVKVPQGLSEGFRKFLSSQKDYVHQVLKTAMAINAEVLTEMEIPESYVESLPKNGRDCLGDLTYKNITVEFFDPDEFLSTMDLCSEQKMLDLKNRIEASIVIWTRKMHHKDAKSSAWGSGVSLEKRELFEERAETILFLIKQRFPNIPQSALELSKIQNNRDVGHAVLESYSRIIGNLAHKIMSWIEDVLSADEATHNRSSTAREGTRSWDSLDSKSLLDVMGWDLNQGETKKELSDDSFRHCEEVIKKKVTNIVTNRRSSYLETLGALRSPTSRH